MRDVAFSSWDSALEDGAGRGVGRSRVCSEHCWASLPHPGARHVPVAEVPRILFLSAYGQS